MTDQTPIEPQRWQVEQFGAQPSVFHDGQLIEMTRGAFRGETLRVNGSQSYYNHDRGYVEGDPKKGIVHEPGWQIILEIKQDGEWVYAIREHEDEILKYAYASREYSVAVYELDQAYGGPEEGGWWFTTGERVENSKVRVVGDREEARRIARRINRALHHKRITHPRRGLSSVAYAGGHYEARVFEGSPPANFPEHRPHYE